MIKRLRLKFIGINMALVTAMLLVIFGMVLHFTVSRLEVQSNQALHAVMEDHRNSFLLPGRQREEVRLPYFHVSINPFGEVTATSGGYFDLTDKTTLGQIISAASKAEEEIGLLRDYNLRFYKKATPFGYNIAFVDVSSHTGMVQDLAKTCGVIGLLSFTIFLGISFLLSRWAVGPVETAWNQQRQFIADASHELKTPLTVITTNAELLQTPDYSDTDRQQFTASILTMSRQMRELVESMLDLARVDNGSAKMAFSPIDLSSLLSDALLPFEPVYFEKGLTLESQIQESLLVNGSETHLNQIADILLDNAAKYSAAGGTVILRAVRQGNHCLFSVASPGDPISKADLKNIFRRFYRIDPARGGQSYGLGLSIAQSIVAEHGGKIWAESNWGINTFFVQLPALSMQKNQTP